VTGSWPYARAIAHRGGGSFAPENTLAAFETGARYGLKMAEFDVKLSADDTVFLLHDDRVDRTSDGHGPAAELRYDDIARFDAGSWFDPGFAGERMPTLAAVAQQVQQLGMDANIEIKPSRGCDARTGERVAREATMLWREGSPPLLSSFSEEALAAARAAAPELPRGLLVLGVPPDWSERVQRLDCLSIHVWHPALDATTVRAFKDAGLCVMAYTVNDLDRARTLLAWGVDALCTDRIDLIGPHTM
jgi:glycerophosphoryl diester phosphodiesterase